MTEKSHTVGNVQLGGLCFQRISFRPIAGDEHENSVADLLRELRYRVEKRGMALPLLEPRHDQKDEAVIRDAERLTDAFTRSSVAGCRGIGDHGVLVCGQSQHGRECSRCDHRSCDKDINGLDDQAVQRIVEHATRALVRHRDVVHHVHDHRHSRDARGNRRGAARDRTRIPPIVDVNNVGLSGAKHRVHASDVPSHAELSERQE